MFEARLVEGKIFKQIIESIKDLVNDTNLDCTEEELSIQCMDSSHVALVAMSLTAAAFDHYRCDRNLSLGINSANMSKILKMMSTDDVLVLKANDDGDTLSMVFESTKNETIADFELKLMDINTDQLTVPDTPYSCTVQMPSSEFQRIIRDLQVLGDSCTIACNKEGIRFTVSGAIGTGSILTRANSAPQKKEDQVIIAMEEPVELNFALRYLNFFTRASSLSGYVILSMSSGIPIMIEFPIGSVGFVKFYLAPKIEENGDEEEE